MSKPFRFMLGLWAGASAIAGGAAWIYAFMTTGKIVVPNRHGCELVEIDQAADRLDEWIEIKLGGLDE